MQFGVQFFPDVRPEEKSGEQYFQEALDLAEEADRLGFSHIRIVEHYFHHYGGYSPNPIVFLAAAAQRTRRTRLVTGAVLPAFNHPLKLAGEIAMLDALSRGLIAEKLRPLLAAYREAWKAAGHPGQGEVMVAFHMYCEHDDERARAFATPLIDAYLTSLVEAASDWLDGRVSQDYPGYDKIIAALQASNAAEQIASGGAWVGSPGDIAATIARLQHEFGGFEHASLQVNFNTMPHREALASMRLFAQEVMPRFTAG